MLFEEVAKIEGYELHKQDLANSVNSFDKMDHRSPVLFQEVAKEAIARISEGEITAQDLANTV